MRMVFALIFFINGEVDESKTRYYVNKHSCVYMCQELARPQRKYETVDCVCKVTWVDNSTRVIK